MLTVLYEESDSWHHKSVVEFAVTREYDHKYSFVPGFLCRTYATVYFNSNHVDVTLSENDHYIMIGARFMLCKEIDTIFIISVNGTDYPDMSQPHNMSYFDLETMPDEVRVDLLHCFMDLFRDTCKWVRMYTPQAFSEAKQKYAHELCKSGCALPLHISVLYKIAWYMKPWWFDYF